MTAEEKLNKIRLHIYKEIEDYKKLWIEDIKRGSETDKAMDREGMRVLTKIKIILKEE